MHEHPTQEDVNRIVQAVRRGRVEVRWVREDGQPSGFVIVPAQDLSDRMRFWLGEALLGEYCEDEFALPYSDVEGCPVAFDSPETAQLHTDAWAGSLELKLLFGLFQQTGVRYNRPPEDMPVRLVGGIGECT